MRRRDSHRHRPSQSPSSSAPASSEPAASTGWLSGGWRGRRTAFAGLLLFTISALVMADWWSTIPADAVAKAGYVGRQTCIECHQRQGELWTGSHHDLAMDHATSETVLGNFDDATLSYHGIDARMFRRDGKYFVHTEGPDGKLADFEVKYVLGVAPLQQYMVEFDRLEDQPANELGRLQVLRECWDTERGRWFYLPPPDVRGEKLAPDDELHWTGTAQRWNSMCADCHSTNLQRNFDVSTKRYHTTFSEIDVSCEACHGPGSVHVELARAKSLFWDRRAGYGLPRLKGENSQPQIDTCTPCHSRRQMLHANPRPGEPFHQSFSNELLGELTYYPDGQIKDEVYEHGSFLQSKMYHKGIKCSDCHDPHSARLKHEGNKLCTSCHAHSPGKYDGPAHTHHQPGSTGASCVECHMPETTYMEVDPRRDHSIRVPRPNLSVALGTPNACTRCHLQVDKTAERLTAEKREGLEDYGRWLERRATDAEVRAELERVDRWARDKALAWWGEKLDDSKHYAHTLDAARRDPRGAEPKLTALAARRDAPSIVRATALMHLGGLDTAKSLAAAREALASPDAQLRSAAILRYETQLAAIGEVSAPPQQLESLFRPLVRDLEPLLDDPIRLVRFEAARQLARVPDPILRSLLRGDVYELFERAIDEYVAGLRSNNDRGTTFRNLAQLYENRGQLREAEQAYRTAIELEPRAAGARSGLALLLERWVESQSARRASLAEAGNPGNAAELVQIDRSLDRAKGEVANLRLEELPLLERDARLLPEAESIQYRYAMALYLSGDERTAESVLNRIVEQQPRNERAMFALALLFQKQQRWPEAESLAAKLLEIRPNDPSYQQFQAALRSRDRGQ